MRLIFLFVCFAFCKNIAAQDIANPGDAKNGSLSEKGIYRFPAFTEGTIVFRNGGNMAVKLNYNITMDEMHFINGNGDTLAVADPPIINYISISPYRFYYDKGYLQTITTSDGIILAFKQVISAEETTKGAFGIATTHPGATTYNFFTLKGQRYGSDNQETMLDAREFYYFGDSYGHFSKANKEFILLHYEKKQDSIKTFLKTNHTNFNKEDDLVKLIQYCGQLQ
ncbi:MAG: hypothetical protein ABJC98_14100 [Bacteroidota bacterium]